MTAIDFGGVAPLIREVARTEIQPLFRALADSDIREKTPGDLVTVADEAAEVVLTKGLQELSGGLPVVGEEAVSADPAVLELLNNDLAWVVDPIDGTRAFVEGKGEYAVMVALVKKGLPISSWIYLPEHQEMYEAHRGGGVQRNGQQLPPAESDLGDLRAGLATYYFPPGVRENVEPRVGDIGPRAFQTHRLWAGSTYAALLSGSLDLAMYWRTHPWDHAPGALLLREYGGVSIRPDGTDYRVGDGKNGLVVATSPEVGTRIRAILGWDENPPN